jgi:hypothetical protein
LVVGIGSDQFIGRKYSRFVKCWETLVGRKALLPGRVRRVMHHFAYLAIDAYIRPRVELTRLWQSLPAVHGSLPSALTVGRALLAFGDPVFLGRFGPALVKSVAEKTPATHIHLHAFGKPDERLIKELSAVQQVSLSWEPNIASGMTALQQRRFYQSMRFVRLAQFLEEGNTAFLAIDIDSIVCKNLEQTFEMLEKVDIGLIIRREFADPGKRILAAAVFAAPTEKGKRFVRAAADRMLPHIFMAPFTEKLDQRCFSLTYKKLAGSTQIASLPFELASLGGDDAIITSYRGSRKDLHFPSAA